MIGQPYYSRKKIWAVLILIAAALAGWFHTFGYQTFYDLRAAWREEAELEVQIEELQQQNTALEQEIEDLGPGGPGIEKKAREDLGWSKENEVIIRIPEKE